MRSLLSLSLALVLCLVSASQLHAQYCIPDFKFGCSDSATSATKYDINSFVLNGIDSSIIDTNIGCSSSGSHPGYDSRISESVNLYLGHAYNGYINTTATDTINNAAIFQIYIDFNDDGVFSEEESVVSIWSYSGVVIAPDTAGFSIHIPASGTGIHRMRVILCSLYDCPEYPINPCAQNVAPGTLLTTPYRYGAVHDYSVNILNSPICDTPTALSIVSITAHSAGINTSVSSTGISSEYVVDQSPSDPIGHGAIVFGEIVLDTFAAGTQYYVHLRDECSGGMYSNWITRSFRTLDEIPTGTTNTTVAQFNLTAAPIPVKDQATITIHGDKGANARAQLIDITGRIIAAQQVNSNSFSFDISTQPSGIYFIKYMDTEHVQTIKISKQ